MITRLEKVTVYVNSQEEAKAFWLEKMRFVVALEQAMGQGMTWLEVAPAGENQTSLILYSKELMLKTRPEMVSHPGVMFACDDPEALWHELKEKGVEVDELQRMPYGTMFNFKDPDGNAYMVRG